MLGGGGNGQIRADDFGGLDEYYGGGSLGRWYLFMPRASRGMSGSEGLVRRGRMRGVRLLARMFWRAKERFLSSMSCCSVSAWNVIEMKGVGVYEWELGYL